MKAHISPSQEKMNAIDLIYLLWDSGWEEFQGEYSVQAWLRVGRL